MAKVNTRVNKKIVVKKWLVHWRLPHLSSSADDGKSFNVDGNDVIYRKGEWFALVLAADKHEALRRMIMQVSEQQRNPPSLAIEWLSSPVVFEGVSLKDIPCIRLSEAKQRCPELEFRDIVQGLHFIVNDVMEHDRYNAPLRYNEIDRELLPETILTTITKMLQPGLSEELRLKHLCEFAHHHARSGNIVTFHSICERLRPPWGWKLGTRQFEIYVLAMIAQQSFWSARGGFVDQCFLRRLVDSNWIDVRHALASSEKDEKENKENDKLSLLVLKPEYLALFEQPLVQPGCFICGYCPSHIRLSEAGRKYFGPLHTLDTLPLALSDL